MKTLDQLVSTQKMKLLVYGQSDEEEMWAALSEAVELYRGCQKRGVWPQSSSSCSNWGGCQYRDVCSLDAGFRETAIQQIYGQV